MLCHLWFNFQLTLNHQDKSQCAVENFSLLLGILRSGIKLQHVFLYFIWDAYLIKMSKLYIAKKRALHWNIIDTHRNSVFLNSKYVILKYFTKSFTEVSTDANWICKSWDIYKKGQRFPNHGNSLTWMPNVCPVSPYWPVHSNFNWRPVCKTYRRHKITLLKFWGSKFSEHVADNFF